MAVPALVSGWVVAATIGWSHCQPGRRAAAVAPLGCGLLLGALKEMVWWALGCCPAGVGRKRLAGLSFPWGRLGSGRQLSSAPALAVRLLGSFLSLSPEYTFVLEDEGGLCGYAAGALCAEGFLQQRDHGWLPAMRCKYPRDLGAGAPALGQVRGHLEQRGAGIGGGRGFLHLCLLPAGCPGRSTALLP